jgi:hypothetical protein
MKLPSRGRKFVLKIDQQKGRFAVVRRRFVNRWIYDAIVVLCVVVTRGFESNSYIAFASLTTSLLPAFFPTNIEVESNASLVVVIPTVGLDRLSLRDPTVVIFVIQ